MAVNGLWSPLYALLVGAVLRGLKPSAAWEFPLVHVVGFGIYVIALGCFNLLWIEFGRAGLRPGDRVAAVGGTSGFWARLAKVRVVADLPDGADFWLLGPDARSRAVGAFWRTGAKAIVVFAAPGSKATDGWMRISQTDHYLYLFEPSADFSDCQMKRL